MKTKIINLIIGAGWHEGELSVAEDIHTLYVTEMDILKRKLREAETMILTLSKNTPVKPPPEPVEVPSITEFLKFFSITTQREMYFNNMLTRTWACEAMENYVLNYYGTPIKPKDDGKGPA
jgi:hypothetical protein